jgi:hypothetical protein
MLLRQGSTFVGSILRKYLISTMGAFSSQIKEAYALHFRDHLFNRPICIIHDHENLPDVFSQDCGQNDFVTHIIHDTKPHLTSAKFIWKPCTHPDIRLVDALGRFSPG